MYRKLLSNVTSGDYCKVYDSIAVIGEDIEEMTCTLWKKRKATANKPTEKQAKQQALEKNYNDSYQPKNIKNSSHWENSDNATNHTIDDEAHDDNNYFQQHQNKTYQQFDSCNFRSSVSPKVF